jgi:hypothetical protein
VAPALGTAESSTVVGRGGAPARGWIDADVENGAEPSRLWPRCT